MAFDQSSNLALVNEKFVKFGSYFYTIGVLIIVQFIIGFIGGFLPFGFALSILGSVISLTIFIIFLLALSTIKQLNQILNNPNLKNFHSKLVASIILSIIGNVIVMVIDITRPGAIYYFLQYLQGNISTLPTGTMRALGIQFLGNILIWIGYILQYSGYKSLYEYFWQYQSAFPPALSGEIITGAKNLKTGALMYILEFLFITIIIGFIYNLIGYFKLGGNLKQLQNNPINENIFAQPGMAPMGAPMGAPGYYTYPTNMGPTPATIMPQGPGVPSQGGPTTITPQTTPGADGEPKFCPVCGALLIPGAKFCPKCGNPIKRE